MARSARNLFSSAARSTPDQSAGDVDPSEPGTVWLGRQPNETPPPAEPAPKS